MLRAVHGEKKAKGTAAVSGRKPDSAGTRPEGQEEVALTNGSTSQRAGWAGEGTDSRETEVAFREQEPGRINTETRAELSETSAVPAHTQRPPGSLEALADMSGRNPDPSPFSLRPLPPLPTPKLNHSGPN